MLQFCSIFRPPSIRTSDSQAFCHLKLVHLVTVYRQRSPVNDPRQQHHHHHPSLPTSPPPSSHTHHHHHHQAFDSGSCCFLRSPKLNISDVGSARRRRERRLRSWLRHERMTVAAEPAVALHRCWACSTARSPTGTTRLRPQEEGGRAS